MGNVVDLQEHKRKKEEERIRRSKEGWARITDPVWINTQGYHPWYPVDNVTYTSTPLKDK